MSMFAQVTALIPVECITHVLYEEQVVTKTSYQEYLRSMMLL
jgi:hypothetical protein